MYDALGDEAKQQKIRTANPDSTHCSFLREDPSACEHFWRGGHYGICPLNPYKFHPERVRTAERMRVIAPIYNFGNYLYGLVRLGLHRPETLSSSQVVLIQLVARVEELEAMKVQGRQIGNAVAEVLAAVFGVEKQE